MKDPIKNSILNIAVKISVIAIVILWSSLFFDVNYVIFAFIAIGIGMLSNFFSEGVGKVKFKNSIKSILIAFILITFICLLYQKSDYYGGLIGFIYLFILGFCPFVGYMILGSIISQLITFFLEGYNDKSL